MPIASIVTTVVVAALAFGSSAGPALATPDLSKASLLLSQADVPAGLRVTGGWEFTAEAATGLRPDLCTSNGKEIVGVLAPTMYQVELGERTTAGQHGLQHQVFAYPTPTAARTAFATLAKRAATCKGVTLESETKNGPKARQRLTNGRATQVVDGERGVWVYSDYANSVASKDWADGGYNLFYLAGDSIHALQYDIPDSIPTTMAARRQVNALGSNLAQRWMSAGSAG